jgi:hypothetical protein
LASGREGEAAKDRWPPGGGVVSLAL